MAAGLLLADILTSHYIPAHLGIGDGHCLQFTYCLTAFSRFLGRPATAADLDRATLLAFLSDYSQRVRPATVNSKRTYLLALWRFAADESLGVAPPPQAKKIPKMPEGLDVPEAWTVDEFSRVLAAAGSRRGSIAGLPAADWLVSLLLTLYDCGGRIGAVRRTRCCDVSLGEAWIVLRSATSKTRRGAVYRLSGQTVEALERIWATDRPLLWPWPHSREALDQRLRRLLGAAGVAFGRERGGLWHKFRRTSGTLVEANGGDGSRHLGNTRKVFERHYLDPRIAGGSQLPLLPRPAIEERKSGNGEEGKRESPRGGEGGAAA